ncbi:bifunctional DNA primase/polymerase [Changpingibacter yushuensis]|uniref:bifunctional DNA primase/polymerase n=1 Tax=Changpingibacter yushuensis TaxID=2758440 RepID=UPI0015F764C5|nr:bifunctional DNA primase/polymerase [Changpingibacter yushuensis]
MNTEKEAAPDEAATSDTSILADTHPCRPNISFLGDAALDYAANGWSVLPCWETGTRPKSPRIAGGFKNATTSLTQVAEWWHRWPQALIGLALPPSVVVLDLDEPRALASLQVVNGGPLPATLTAVTGRAGGGYHYYFTHRITGLSQCGVRDRGGKLVPHVDVRVGGRGYVIAPPSPHPATGVLYEWCEGPMELAELPAALADALAPPAPRPMPVAGSTGYHCGRALDGLVRTMVNAKVGERNTLLFWVACRMVEREQRGLTTDWAGLEQAALSTGLSASEIRVAVASSRKQVAA